MVKDAESHAAEDKTRREEVEVRNQADTLTYQVDKQLSENADKIDPATKARVEAAIQRVREALKGQSASEIKAATQDLEQTFQATIDETRQARSTVDQPCVELHE